MTYEEAISELVVIKSVYSHMRGEYKPCVEALQMAIDLLRQADTPQLEVEDGEDYLRGYNDGYYARGVLDKAGVEIHIDKPRGFTLKSISDTPQTKNVVGNKATLTIKDGVVKVTPQTECPWE